MFESAELGHKITKDVYKQAVPELRESLLEAQYDLLESAKFPVIILIGGVDGAGKGETVNLLNAWMDPRHINTHAFGAPTEEERQRPAMWRFWRALPPKGEIGILFGSWYTAPIADRTYGKIKNEALDNALEEIVRFERMLTDEGALIIKLWFHLSKQRQKQRIKTLQKDPDTAWRVTEQDLKHLKHYDKFRNISSRVLSETSTANAPWIVIEGYDANYRNLTAGNYILEAIGKRLRQAHKKSRKTPAPPLLQPLDKLRIIDTLDLTQALPKADYEKQLEKYQSRLNWLTREAAFRKHAVVCVFEGADAAGKGGSIRRVTQALDARYYQIIPVAAPTEEERAQPYLWRFWRHLPGKGRVTIFDRSWYGRVLVERVEGYCSEQDWMRAYAEINDFEEQLANADILLMKFWLQISPDEQLKRFEERQQIPFKRFKITPEDWRNRKKWPEYQDAVSDMVDRTSTEAAPWTLVEANDKHHARIKILRTWCENLERLLD